jgi:AcrR family transcriptional regulator
MKAGKATRPRRYENRNRVAQALETRRRVIDAAARLFARDGYAATTIQGLADEAGVAVQTVYSAFGSKRQVLKELFDTSVVGDTNEVALVARPEWRVWEDEPDPVGRIEAFARAQRLICERAAHVHRILSAAASADAEIADLYRDAERARYADQARLAGALDREDHLPQGLTIERAADIIWTLAGPAIYNDLVGARGWSPPEYENWLASQLRFVLLVIDMPRRR